jgi:hypothetical protein
MVAPAWSTRALPCSTRSTLALMSALISRAASALRPARLRTSLATTAKPRPCSPARAASTAAFSARMLVWKAMPSITPMMSAILLAGVVDAVSWFPPPAHHLAALHGHGAGAHGQLVGLAGAVGVLRTVALSSSMEAAVSSSALAWLSVRADRSWLPWAGQTRLDKLQTQYATGQCADANGNQ